MIAACPRCAARYRLDPRRIGPQGARLRCAKCEAVFRVRSPEAILPPALESGRAEASRADANSTQLTPQHAATEEAPTLLDMRRPVDRELLVLIADSDVEVGKQTAAAVASWGLQPILVHDGVEAMLTIQRMGPCAVILDAALPKMFGFQICEIVKRNESLRDTHVVLIGAVHHRDRYRSTSEELYGADVYVERSDVPDGLGPVLRRLGLAVQIPGEPNSPTPVTPPTPAPMERPTLVEMPAPAPAAVDVPDVAPKEPTPAAADGLDDERAKAERLARIIVSDIVLYNPETFDDAVEAGDVVTALDSVLGEGRELFRQRIDDRVRDERDYLEAELLRVASERAAR